jgi:uncharacterized repeat protein (TIGR04002 family)
MKQDHLTQQKQPTKENRIEKRERLRLMVLTALLTAIVYILTAYLHIPVGRGYVHLGDGVLYLAACVLPLPHGIFVGSVGAALADCLSGFHLWAPASAIIKALTVLCFTRKSKKLLCTRNILALPLAALLCVGGYYIYEALLYGSFLSPLASIPGNLIQSLCSSALFLILSPVWSSRINKGF